MANSLTPSEDVHNRIHFDTLLEQAKQIISDYASGTWSDLAEHDPGITLLQALCYGVSDLAYRHTLPLEDLLTPESGTAEIFSKKFAPENMLTSGPITEDDYRRALLDLHSLDDTKNKRKYTHHDFYFRNVQLTKEPVEKHPRYWYDSKKREWLLVYPGDAIDSAVEDIQEQVVLGGFDLYVELNLGMTQERAQPQLEQFLETHRNFCEEVRDIIWVKPHTESVFRADIELDDDCQNPEEVMVQVLTKAQAMVCPVVSHLTVSELTKLGKKNEDIYQGPQLKNGWLPELPKRRNYADELPITISRLVNDLLEIKGIKRIQKLGFGKECDSVDVEWSCTIPANKYLQIWQGKTFNTPDDIKALSKQVILLHHGRRVMPDAKKMHERIDRLHTPLIDSQSVPQPRPRYRNPIDYHEARKYLPPCYGLHAPNPDPKQAQLRQFLLLFEQQLADGCAQLALLPELLSFEHDKNNNQVWGKHLDFIKREQSSNAELITILKNKAQDHDKEQAIINYLLSYFGAPPLLKVFLEGRKEACKKNLLSIQRAYLAQQGELGYERASIQMNAVSALQRRIAARIGYDVELFWKIQKDVKKKFDYPNNPPFYIVEHRALLPKIFLDAEKDESKWENITRIMKDPNASSIKIIMETSSGLQKWKYINLKLDKYVFIDVKANYTNEKEIVVYLNEHEQLENYINSNSEEYINNLKRKLQSCNLVKQFSLTEEKLTITINRKQRKLAFKEGQIVDIKIKSHTVFSVKIDEAHDDKDQIIFYLRNNMQLKNTINSIGKIKKENINLHPSIIWLKDKAHPIKLDEKNKQWMVSDTCLNPGDEIIIVSKEIGKNDFLAEVESVNPAINGFTLKGGRHKINKNKDIFYIKKNKIGSNFNFAISVVFSQTWLKGAIDPYATEEWVKKIISEEVPYHISAKIHWFSEEKFERFADKYAQWQDEGTSRWGAIPYELLSDLSLGERPTPINGIGMMMIAPDNSEFRDDYINANRASRRRWGDDEVGETGIFFVPNAG